MNDKKELQVAALENGTVIDHIPSEKLFTVVSLLGLEHMNNNITIGFNLNSKKLGKKGIIKIADKFFCDDVKCANPKCITNNEPMLTRFHVIDKERCVIKCHYCEKEQTREEIEII